MVDVIKYDKAGKESGTLGLNPEVFDVEVNHEAVKEYLLLQLSNRRRANPTTKTRSQVRGGGRKPWKQKGTGRARAGTRSSPLWTGGGVAHGPTGKNHTKAMPKKVRRLALRSVLTECTRNGNLAIIDDLNPEVPKTREMSEVVQSMGGGKILFIEPDRIDNLELATRNLPQVKTLIYRNLNPHDLLNYRVVILQSALEKIEEVVL